MDRRPFDETHPHLKEFTCFLDALNAESDRGAALISVAMLDDLLEKAILAFLVDTSEKSKLLSGFNAPLGTFSARCLAAYSLGLISENEFRECDRIRRIRNQFAHSIYQSFEDQKIRDLCASLTFSAKGDKMDAKALFTTAALGLILGLTNRPHYVALGRLQYGNWRR